MKFFKILPGVFLLALLGACATPMDGLYISEAFTLESIKTHKLTIGGVIDETDDNRLENNYSKTLFNQIHEERKDYKVQSVDSIKQKLNNDYLKMLEAYNKHGLTQKWLEKMADLQTSGRFLAFSTIEENTTHKSDSRKEASIGEDVNGQEEEIPGEIVKKHSRKIRASIQVYDLHSKASAFSGSVTVTLKRANTYEISKLDSAVDLITGLAGNKNNRYTYPKPPQKQEVLRAVFKGFAENMPD